MYSERTCFLSDSTMVMDDGESGPKATTAILEHPGVGPIALLFFAPFVLSPSFFPFLDVAVLLPFLLLLLCPLTAFPPLAVFLALSSE